jgi:hypothetical protein
VRWQKEGLDRNACGEDKTVAEKRQESRDKVEAIQVANGGKPAQQRTYSAPAPAAPARSSWLIMVAAISRRSISQRLRDANVDEKKSDTVSENPPEQEESTAAHLKYKNPTISEDTQDTVSHASTENTEESPQPRSSSTVEPGSSENTEESPTKHSTPEAGILPLLHA